MDKPTPQSLRYNITVYFFLYCRSIQMSWISRTGCRQLNHLIHY